MIACLYMLLNNDLLENKANPELIAELFMNLAIFLFSL